MSKIKCLLIDDEPPAIVLLKKYASLIDKLEIVGTGNSAIKAFEILNEQEVDLMFIDIRMPMLNGIDFIKTLKNPPAIILTTAYREYALESYDLDIIDYLLKPIAFDRFLKAIDRYQTRLKPTKVSTEATPEIKQPEYIICNVNRTYHKILLSDIVYIESLKDYVSIHTKSDKVVVKGNIGSFMQRLPTDRFVRIHRSFIVAPEYVTSFSQTEVSIGQQVFPVGRSYKDVMKNWI